LSQNTDYDTTIKITAHCWSFWKNAHLKAVRHVSIMSCSESSQYKTTVNYRLIAALEKEKITELLLLSQN